MIGSRPTMNTANTDRARSLNPMIYPSWWGDIETLKETEKGKSNGVGKNTF